MLLFYIFLNTDVESFGPVPALHSKISEGLKVYLYTITKSGMIESIGDKLYFEFFMEKFDPPVSKLTDKISKVI